MNEEIDFEEFAPWLVAIITLIGGALRLLLLAKNGLWLDETFSLWMASQRVGEMLHWLVRIDQHPPLYYLLLHCWIGYYGDTPYAVRLLSVLWGTATIPIIYLIGKRLAGVALGLAAAVLLAFSLFNIYYAQEARMYTLLTFNAAVAIYALARLLTDPRAARPIGAQLRDYRQARRRAAPVAPAPSHAFSYGDQTRARSGWLAWLSPQRWNFIHTVATDLTWVTLIVFSVATLLTHNTAVLFLVATNLFVLGLLLWQRIKQPGAQSALQAPALGNWVKAQLAILLLWSPWLVFFMKQASAVEQRFWISEPTWDAVLRVILAFLNPAAYLPAHYIRVIWTVYLLVLALGVLYFRKKFAPFLWLAALFAIPFLGELLVSLRRPIFSERTLIWTTIPLYLALAAGITQLRFRPLMILVLGALSAINLFSAADYYRFYQKEDWQTAAGYVANFAEKDDLLLFNSNFVVIPFNYYFRSYEDRYHIQVEKQGVPRDLFDDGILEPAMTADDIPALVAVLRGHDRVWLVYSHELYTDPLGLIPETLAAQKRLIRTREFYGGRVQLYETP